MQLTAETHWTPDFAAGVLARRACIRSVPYTKYVSLEMAELLTELPIHRILSEFDILVLANSEAVVHPDKLIRYQKRRMIEVISHAEILHERDEQAIQSAQQSLLSRLAA